ncbi:MAG: hypothetical protein ACYCW6_15195 [Candidatus Xenobia bacterium]
MDDLGVLHARSAGEGRFFLLRDVSGDLSRVLSRCGLEATAEQLRECDQSAAEAILGRLLWKDMAYGQPCMAEADAAALAHQLVERYSGAASRYLSNGEWERDGGWTPFTSATFDGGILIEGPDHRYFCLWFEDED